MKGNVMLTPLALAANVQAHRHALESWRWRHGERGSRSANELQWRRQA